MYLPHAENGLTALDIASSCEQPEVYQILAVNGAVHGTHTQHEVQYNTNNTSTVTLTTSKQKFKGKEQLNTNTTTVLHDCHKLV